VYFHAFWNGPWHSYTYRVKQRLYRRDICGTTHAKEKLSMKFNHIGIPTQERFTGEIDIPHLKITVSDHTNNPFGIQWMRYWEDAPYPDIVKTIPHVAFEVDDLEDSIKNQKIVIAPNSPSPGVIVAIIEVNGAPVELMQIDRSVYNED
jgi:hypothetical protein